MTTSKFYIIVMSTCCFMAIGNKPSCAATPLKEVEKALLEVGKEHVAALSGSHIDDSNTYVVTKEYANIKSATLRGNVQHLCRYTCNRMSCQAQEMKDKCEELCPKKDIPNCLSAQVQTPGLG